MNCAFCNNTATNNPPHAIEMDMFVCRHCSNERLTVEFCLPTAQYHWIALVSDLYCVEISFIDNKTRFFRNVTDESETLILTIQNTMDIRPDNFFEIIEKLDRWLPLR